MVLAIFYFCPISLIFTYFYTIFESLDVKYRPENALYKNGTEKISKELIYYMSDAGA